MYVLTPAQLRRGAPHVTDWLDHAASNVLHHAYGATSQHKMVQEIDALGLEVKFDVLRDFLFERGKASLGHTSSENDRLDWAFDEMERCVYGQSDVVLYKVLLFHLVQAAVARGRITRTEYQAAVQQLGPTCSPNTEKSAAHQTLSLGLQVRAVATAGLLEPSDLDALLGALDPAARTAITDAIARNDQTELAADLFAAAVID